MTTKELLLLTQKQIKLIDCELPNEVDIVKANIDADEHVKKLINEKCKEIINEITSLKGGINEIQSKNNMGL